MTLLALPCGKKNIRNTGRNITIKIKRRTDINQGIFIPQGWMISAQTTQLDLQQTFNGKTYLVVGQPNGIVTVSDVEVERDAPHDNESHVDLHQLPADGAAGPHHGVRVLKHHHLPEYQVLLAVLIPSVRGLANLYPGNTFLGGNPELVVPHWVLVSTSSSVNMLQLLRLMMDLTPAPVLYLAAVLMS